MPTVGHKLEKYFEWGSKWQVGTDDNSIDINGQKCNTLDQPSDKIPDPVSFNFNHIFSLHNKLNIILKILFFFKSTCINEQVYRDSDKWCNLMINPQGPWKECLSVSQIFI